MEYEKLLEEHGIKPTANRILVVKALASSMQPLSLAELERRIMTIDKSNVFRALSLFREHHLVHTIEGSGDGTRYELCHSHASRAAVMGRATNSATVMTTTTTRISIPISSVRYASRRIVWTIWTCLRSPCRRALSFTPSILC